MKASTPQLNVKSQRTSNWACVSGTFTAAVTAAATALMSRSEEHTSELQSRSDLVCRLLLEKKKKSTTARIDPWTRKTIANISRRVRHGGDARRRIRRIDGSYPASPPGQDRTPAQRPSRERS